MRHESRFGESYDRGMSSLVRDAEVGDADGIAQVHVDAWRETYSGVLADHYFSADVYERRREFWTRYLAMDPRPGRAVVAERDGSVVGFANAGAAHGPDVEKGYPSARPLHLYTIYLLAAEHGRGLGQQLLDGAIGDEPAQLWVMRGNARAIAFYERNGFVADGVEFVEPDDPNLIEVRMVR